MGKTFRKSIFNTVPALAFVMVAILAACQGTNPTEEALKDPVEEAYVLIDQGSFGAAITSLEELQTRDPRSKVRLALASAYAGRAGIRVENYWGFVVGFDAPILTIEGTENSESIERMKNILSQFGNKKPKELQSEQLTKFVYALNEFEMIKRRIDAIPTVEKPAITDINKAMEILSKDSSRAAKSYRAILGLILVKTSIQKGFDRWDEVVKNLEQLDYERPQSKKNKEIICEIPMKMFFTWYSGVLVQTREILQDLSISFPARRGELSTSIFQLSKIDFGQNEESRCQ